MNWLGLTILAGVVGIDATSFAQTMISRPLIAATLTGLLAGRPQEALILGAVLELFALVILPVGAARYPESGTASVAATTGYLLATPVLSPAVMLLAILFALAWERVSGVSVVVGRRFNERLLAPAAVTGRDIDREIERRQWLAIALDFVRAVIVTLVGALLALAVLRALAQLSTMSARVAPALLSLGVCCMVGAALQLFGGVRARAVALGLGVVCGLLLVLLR